MGGERFGTLTSSDVICACCLYLRGKATKKMNLPFDNYQQVPLLTGGYPMHPFELRSCVRKRRRKGRKSMNRRKGQNGTVVIQSGRYRVRWRMDIQGQEERIYMSEKVAPVVIDKDGNQRPCITSSPTPGAGNRRTIGRKLGRAF